MKLKICGMKEHDNIREVAKKLPDYMGFIFYPGSPRYVGIGFTMPDIPASIKRVGVFVNESLNAIKKSVDQYKLDFIQLHGGESVADCHKLKRIAGIIKAFSVDDKFDFKRTIPYAEEVDFFLFDAKGKYYGGNGKTFDWDTLQAYDQTKPFFLSGGLTPDNIDQLSSLKQMNIHALDVNSGVEIKPGLKDIQKIKTLNKKLKQYEIQRR
jgi:phosphoribosylanthranilate isomerase